MSLATLHNPSASTHTPASAAACEPRTAPKNRTLILQSLRKKHAPPSLLNESTPSRQFLLFICSRNLRLTGRHHRQGNASIFTLLTTILVVTPRQLPPIRIRHRCHEQLRGVHPSTTSTHTTWHTPWSAGPSPFHATALADCSDPSLDPKFIGKYCRTKGHTALEQYVFLVTSSAWWWYQAIGRVFVGIVAGIATAVVPTYFSELSPISIRGALGITVGIVISQWLSTPSLNIFGSKKSGSIYSSSQYCLVFTSNAQYSSLCPVSPSYLYQTQGREAAKETLKKLQPGRRRSQCISRSDSRGD
ncbi:hypothetical protein ACHAWO_001928 [Cyclotella atomus]|uniref:Major facilitator superfamily (MFS) profile domain-containing protein n=1 Tax=Cyclotella atomus TaxID=382360 RepID=A0ABD3NJE7_9STRA